MFFIFVKTSILSPRVAGDLYSTVAFTNRGVLRHILTKDPKKFKDLEDKIADALAFMDACGINSDFNRRLKTVNFWTSHEALLLPFEESDLERFADPVGLGLTNGRQYALPMITVVESVIFYNKTMFKEAGISEEPKTWEDLEDAATKLANNNTTPFIVGGAAGDSWAAAWPLMDLVALNVTGKDDNYLKDLRSGDRNFSDPLMKDAIDAVKKLHENIIKIGRAHV